jgi:TRAP-type C4-dicarboxylate transport system substrate-binding protein
MKNKMFLLGSTFFAVVLFFVAVCQESSAQAPKPAAPGKVITWRLAHLSSQHKSTWTYYSRFPDLVKQATNGQLIIEPKADLFGPTEYIMAAIDGRVEMAVQWIPFVSGSFPLLDVCSLPFFFKNIYEYERAINDPRLAKIMEGVYTKAGLVKLFDVPGGPLNAVYSNKPIRTADDFKGLKIRASGLMATATLKSLGASPLTMAITELSDAMSRGTVDAVHSAIAYGFGVGLRDVSKYLNIWPIQITFNTMLFVNQKAWNSLPPDLRQKLREVSKTLEGQEMFAEDIEDRTQISMAKASMSMIIPEKAEIEKAEEITKPVFDQWLKIAGPSGPQVLAIYSEYASGGKFKKR